MRIQCISRPRSTWSLPTTGMLFSAWQATTHALQPVHVVRSIAMPHCALRSWACLPVGDRSRRFPLPANVGFFRYSASVASRTSSPARCPCVSSPTLSMAW